MKIYKYIRHEPFSVDYTQNYTVLDIAALLLKTNHNSMIVTKDKKPIYIITNTDLINFFLQKDDTLSLSEIIQKYPKKILALEKNEDIYEAYNKMRTAGIEHLIVVDKGELLGEVYQQDLVMKFVEFALKDDLTGLNNKRFLDTIIQKYNKTNTQIGVIFVDIDHFKRFNDRYGHKIGDLVIQFVAKQIQKSIRDVDFAFRCGGDEFVVMVFGQEKFVVEKVASRIFDKITSKDDKKFGKVSVTMGIGMYPDEKDDLNEVLKLADKRLYDAKFSGRGKIESNS